MLHFNICLRTHCQDLRFNHRLLKIFFISLIILLYLLKGSEADLKLSFQHFFINFKIQFLVLVYFVLSQKFLIRPIIFFLQSFSLVLMLF